MSGNIIIGVIIGIVLIAIVLLLIFLLKAGEKQVSEKQPDQTAIEGIGPKIASLLIMKGIDSYQSLAMTETAILEAILKQAGLAINDPATWPKQAVLQAVGKMKEL